jgi:AcrR family transcriptional regulator
MTVVETESRVNGFVLILLTGQYCQVVKERRGEGTFGRVSRGWPHERNETEDWMPKSVDHEARRAELADALFAVIERDGISAATIRGVAAEAGWTRGVIGHYFDNRDDLLLFAYREGLTRALDSWRPQVGLPSLDLLTQWLLASMPLDRTSTLNYTIYLAFAEKAAESPGLGLAVATESERFDDVTRGYLTDCLAQGSLTPPLPTDKAADVLITLVDGLSLNAFTNPRRYSKAKIRAMLREFLATWAPPL